MKRNTNLHLEEYLKSTDLNDFVKDSLLKDDGKDKVTYLNYPFLFIESMGVSSSSIGKVYEIAIAGYLYYSSLIVFDNIHDTNTSNEYSVYNINLLQEHSLLILSSLFKRNSSFWPYWFKRKREYFSALENNSNLRMTLDEYEDFADSKAAYGKSAIDAMYVLGGCRENVKYELLLKSHRYLSIGLQLSDDLADLEEDYTNGQFNWILQGIGQRGLKKSIKDITKNYYTKGYAIETYTSIEHYYSRAEKCASEAMSKEWLALIRVKKDEVNRNIRVLKNYLLELEVKHQLRSKVECKEIPTIYIPTFGKYSKLISMAVLFVSKEKAKGYGELKHVMCLDKEEGFTSPFQVQVGDTFQRGIVTDSLISVYDLINDDSLRDLIYEELEYFLDIEDDGWSYFPSVLEIAPDADDLGQIVQCFCKMGRFGKVKDICVPLIESLLQNSENGIIKTWIYPNNKKTIKEQRQSFFNLNKWGEGPDIEVVANFMYALSLVDEDKYKEHFERASIFLLGTQNPRGYWESRWYYGNYYGTFTCLRFLIEIGFSSERIEKAFKFIENTQNTDGGWGKDACSDPLSTSYAILTLSLRKEKGISAMKQGVVYLEETQKEKGNWDAIPFIKPKVGYPYESETLTTALAAKAVSTFLTITAANNA